MQLTKLNSTKLISVKTSGNIDWLKKVSAPQLAAKTFFRPFWQHDNVIEEFYIPGSKLRLDLFNTSKKIVVEVSPDEYHVKFNVWLHKDRFKFLNKVKKDEEKRNWCKRNGLTLIELYNEDLKQLSKEYISTKFGVDL